MLTAMYEGYENLDLFPQWGWEISDVKEQTSDHEGKLLLPGNDGWWRIGEWLRGNDKSDCIGMGVRYVYVFVKYYRIIRIRGNRAPAPGPAAPYLR